MEGAVKVNEFENRKDDEGKRPGPKAKVPTPTEVRMGGEKEGLKGGGTESKN